MHLCTSQDNTDTKELLHHTNVDFKKLCDYVMKVASWCTRLPRLRLVVSIINWNNFCVVSTDICQAEYRGPKPVLYLVHLYLQQNQDKADVALFDFNSCRQANCAAQAIHRGGKDLYLCLVGDALSQVCACIIHAACYEYLSAYVDLHWAVSIQWDIAYFDWYAYIPQRPSSN